ncbi:tegument protein UL51 [Ateline alphaherpesvirus 1]|uniref:Tegument protein UL51 n=1 Tax=Herpesvirus ateles type 1 (strain Lennette) TaxID=35243 RepID=A0A1S6JLL3_HSVA1|nr:tegument protein UL51 [Ateline alphaherpesvirus 1]AQS79165.1 tegument protein UL51 [Ateline alphaherpesvirus 1]
MAGLLRALCGFSGAPEQEYEPVGGVAPPAEFAPRLQEALAAVNALLPSPITLEDALESLEETRRLVRARTLARTYRQCQANLARLARHVPGAGGPGLDGAVQAHREKLRRVADSCLCTILQLYMSVAGTDGASDLLVSQAIQSMAESEVLMEDVAIVERALGLPGEAGAAAESAATPPDDASAVREREAPRDARPVPAAATPPATHGSQQTPRRSAEAQLVAL